MGDDFYQANQRLGSICTINEKNAYDMFNADLKSLSPISGNVSVDFSKDIGSSSLSVNNYKLETGGIKAVFYVGGAYKEDSYINISNLIAECRSCIIKTDEDNFEYVSILTGYDVVETGVEFYNEVSLTFSAVRRLPLVSKSFSGSGTVKNIGSVSSGVRLVITPKADIAELVINGITIRNMSSGIPFIIDGLVGKVMCNGINRFLDTDLIEFPKIMPGDNKVEVSNANVDIEVSYYPTFIV